MVQSIIVGGVAAIIGIIIGVLLANWKLSQIYKYQKNLAIKNNEYFMLMTNWVKLYQHRQNVVNCLKEQGYNNIVIYGMGIIGKCLYDELVGQDIKVLYGIDSEFEGNYKDLMIKKMDNVDRVEHVDAIIVTPIYDFNELENELREKTTTEIVPIDELIFYIDK